MKVCQITNKKEIGAWSIDSNTLPEVVSFSQAVVTKNRVYLLGGYSNYGPTNKIYTAPINPEGTLGTWSIDANTLPENLYSSQAVVIKNRVYLLGGNNGYDDFTNKVYTAPINLDGTLGKWSIDTNTLPEKLCASQAIVIKNRIYLLGGHNASYINKIYTTIINNDGTLKPWSISNNTLPEALTYSQAVVTKNRVYLLGGNIGDYNNKIFTTTIKEDGTLGPWSIDSNTLPNSLIQSQAVVTKNKVYLLGGYEISNNSGSINKIYTANINEDGTLGTWNIDNNTLSENLNISQSIVTNSKVYLLGGYNSNSNNNSITNKIYMANLI